MKNQMYLLTLLFFISCSSIQVKDQELPVARSSESVSFEKAMEDLNVDSFKAALEKSEPLGKRGNAILKLCKEKNVIWNSIIVNQCLVEQVKDYHRPLDMRLAKTQLATLGGIGGGIVATRIRGPIKYLVALASIAAIVYVIYDMNRYEKERNQKVKELEKQRDWLKNKLDILNAMIKLVESNHESEQ